MSKRSIPLEYKLKILKEFEDGHHSIYELASKYRVDWSSITAWKYNFEQYGVDGLKESTTNKKYSKKLKLAAIQDYLSGIYSTREIIRKYGISSTSTLRKWINNYNSHREIKGTTRGMSHSMTKGRSTTWKERLDIALYCISNDKDYHKTAEVYKISYQQAYQWVRKYEAGGEEALKDKRGRKKEEAELSPEELATIKMKKLEKENERLRAENAFLKKLEEMERRRS